MNKICFVATVPYVVNAFLRDHLEALSERFLVTVVTSDDNSLAPLALPPQIRVVRMNLQRQPTPMADMCTLVSLYAYFRRERFIAVHSVTPKAGLLGMAAALFAGVPNRFHHFTGQVWSTRSGFQRSFYKACDRLIGALATRVFTDGHAQSEFLALEGVTKGSAMVLGPGPICGIDMQRFHPDSSMKSEMRRRLSIPAEAVVILFVGRLHREKGLWELVQAMEALEHEAGLILLLVGPSDDADLVRRLEGLPESLRSIIRQTGGVPDPENYMRAADVFVLPSHREGFGMVVLEAAASGLPAVVSDIYGLRDAVEEGVTALKVPVKAPDELAAAIWRLVEDKDLRARMSQAALRRVATSFTRERITDTWRNLYAEVEGEARKQSA